MSKLVLGVCVKALRYCPPNLTLETFGIPVMLVDVSLTVTERLRGRLRMIVAFILYWSVTVTQYIRRSAD